jgi:hypothetical protein
MRNAVVTLVTIVAVMALALFVPSLLPAGLQPSLGGPIGEAPVAAPGTAGDSPQRQLRGGEGSYRFAATQPGDRRTPVSYPSCDPIRVEVNLSGAPEPEADLRMVLDAMERIEEATGLVLEYVGSSDERPRWDDGRVRLDRADLEEPDAVLVSFSDAEEVSQLAGDVAGVAGSVIVERDGWSSYLTGQVTLDTETFEELRERRDGDDVAAAITLHEFAHLVGLDHVDDRRELMFATTTDQRDLAPGDLEGLARLGSGRCR